MTIVMTIGDRNVIHPGDKLADVVEQRTPPDFWGRANSYSCPLGRDAGKAWLLMTRAELNQLDKNTFHALKFTEATTSSTRVVLSIPSLCIVRSLTMDIAFAGEVKAARLVEFQDKRRVLELSSIDSQYNVRIPAPSTTSGTGLYYTDSLNSGSLWTWQTLLTDIWGNLPSTAGTAPTLPYSPDGNPEGFRFIGVSAWEALHIVLKKIGCTSSYDPINDDFSYVRLGTTQSGLAKSLTDLAKRLMFDFDPGDDYQLANMPETVRVFFMRRELYHGVERDTPDTSNWEMAPVVSKDKATGISGAITGSVLPVWDDLPATFDTAGSNSNSAALQTRADEIGDNLRDRIDVSEERFRRIYSQVATTILPGSEVSEVRWRDYGDSTGLVTEIMRGPSDDDACGFAAEHLATPDLSRNTHPVYPRLAQPVQVDDGASATGASLTANGDLLFPGFVLRYTGTWAQLEACWIRPADLDTAGAPSEATVVALRQKDRFVGRLSGSQTSGGTTLPVYVVRAGVADPLPAGSDLFDISADTGTTVTIEAGDTVDFDASDKDFTDTSLGANSTKALRGIVTQIETDGGDATIKHLRIAVDNSVLQQIDLTGNQVSGTDPVVVAAHGDRNELEFKSTDTTSDIELVGGTGEIEFKTVLGPPIGSVIMHYKAPILIASDKYFIDRDGAADSDWALMDGISNVSPGSGIALWERGSGDEDSYFVRARNAITVATDASAGRAVPTADDVDEVKIEIDDHPDHLHQITPDQCHADVAGTDTHFDFSSLDARDTTGVLDTSTKMSLILDHTADMSGGNNGLGSTSEHILLTPPNKKLHYFERVRYTVGGPTTIP